ncbi:hypothetical protein A2U01_0105186, partial [Trifolium medium]|nr:hypothetical protein [Trifolium medium]
WKRDNEDAEPQVLIQWEGSFPEDSTWEQYTTILDKYPDFHLEDKVSLDGLEDVMTHNEDEMGQGYAEKELNP